MSTFANMFFVKTHGIALWLFQSGDGGVRLDPWGMWIQMQWPARCVVIVLFVMSAWSIGVMVDRMLAFRAARRESRKFAPAVAGALREGKLDEAVRVAERNRKSHLAKVVSSGLQEFTTHNTTPATPEEQMEASKQALDRTEAIVHAELERGLGGLATIGSTAPFVGLLGTVIGIIDAFAMIDRNGATGMATISVLADSCSRYCVTSASLESGKRSLRLRRTARTTIWSYRWHSGSVSRQIR